MHILILSGDGDIEKYVYDTGMKINFYVVKNLDDMHFSRINNELRLLSEDAYTHLKGLAIITQRTEIINNVIDYFKFKNKIEYLRISPFGVRVYDFNNLTFHLDNNWELR